MKTRLFAIATLALTAGTLVNACLFTDPDSEPGKKRSPGLFGWGLRPRLEAGATIEVALQSAVSSETARPGDVWHGTVTQDVLSRAEVVIPAGSRVTGQVQFVRPAERGTRATLELAIRSVEVDGRATPVRASAGPVVAGSPRARNLGAIAGGAAAGALLGRAIGGDKDAAVGGLVGGATAAGVVASSKGYQVVLKEGTSIRLTVSETVAMR